MTAYSSKIPFIPLEGLDAQPFPVVAFGREYPAGHLVERHHHERAQILYASKGIVRVDTTAGIWVVPPMHALWIPPKMDHEIRTSSAVELRTLLLQPGLRDSLPRECCVIQVSLLLRALILRAVEVANAGDGSRIGEHMVELVLDEIKQVPVLPMHIPLPLDPRLLRICRGILQNPADKRTSAHWGVAVGASPRTLERLFQREVGVTFTVWRQQVRLLAALSRIAAQEPISVVAFDLGYQSPSAFTAMFKRVLGCPPRDFFPATVATSS